MIEGRALNSVVLLCPAAAAAAWVLIRFGLLSPDTPAELAFVFLHMADLGYAPYSQEVNVIAPHCCCEFTFMRISNMSKCGE